MENPGEMQPHARARGDVPEWLVWCTGQIRRQPLTALTLGATLGFVLGGGIRSRSGRRLLIIAGKTIAGGALGTMLSELTQEYGRDGIRPSTGTEAGTR